MPTNQKRGGLNLGFTPNNPGNGVTVRAINAAGAALALGFVPDASKTLAKVRVFENGTVTGTLGANDLVCTIYNDTGSGAGPGSTNLGSTNTLTAPIAANSWVEFTGLSVALTAGVQYWAVITNVNGTPASNCPNIGYGGGGTAPMFSNSGGSNTYYGWQAAWNSGGGYGTNAPNVAGLVVAYSDGSLDGLPVQNIGNTPSAYRAYLARETGVLLTLPANATFNIRRVSFYLSKTGSPASDLVFRIYSGTSTTPLATSNAVLRANINGSALQYITAYFGSDVAVAGGTTIRITAAMATNTAGDASNTWLSPVTYTFDPANLALLPFAAQLTMLNTTWDDLDTNLLIPFDIGLDSGGEFAASGGGSYAAASDVRLGVDRGDGTSGTCRVPAVGNVKTLYAYDAADSLTGTYDGSDRWTDPGVANVLLAVAYKANSTSNNRTGTVTMPIVGDVEGGVTFGASLGSTGTFTVPTVGNVASGVGYGAGGTEFTGTLSGGSGPSAATIVTTLLTELLSSSDFNTANSLGAALKASLTTVGVLVSAGTGTGQVSLASGVVAANVVQVNGTTTGLSDGTATAGGANTITLGTGVTFATNALRDRVITLTGGTGAGQSEVIVSNTNATPSVATISRNWLANPSTDTTYTIDPTNNATLVATATTAITATNLTNLPSVPTDWLTAAGVKADAVTKVQAGLATPTNITSGTITTVSGNVAGSVASVAGNVGGSVASVTAAVAVTSNVKKNQALNNYEFVMTDSTTHAPKTGVTVTATRSLDGAAFASCANAVSEVASGVYKINLATTDTNANVVTMRFTGTGADDLLVGIITQP